MDPTSRNSLSPDNNKSSGKIRATRQKPQLLRSARYLSCLLLAAQFFAPGLLQAQVIDFTWTHDGAGPPNVFRFYKGPDVNNLSPIQDIPYVSAPNYSTQYTWTDGAGPVCFGVSAQNDLGESAVITETTEGKVVCLGKPTAPTTFNFNVQ